MYKAPGNQNNREYLPPLNKLSITKLTSVCPVSSFLLLRKGQEHGEKSSLRHSAKGQLKAVSGREMKRLRKPAPLQTEGNAGGM